MPDQKQVARCLCFIIPMVTLCLGLSAQAEESIIYVDGFAVDTMDDSATEVFGFDGLELDGPIRLSPRSSKAPSPKAQLVLVGSTSSQALGRLLSSAERAGKAQQWADALSAITHAIELAPRRIDVRRKGAVYASLAGAYDQAEAHYMWVLEQSPNEPIMLGGYAAVLIRNGKLDRAEQVLNQAEKIAGDQMIVRFNWACLEAIGKVSDKTDAWDRINVAELVQILNWFEADLNTLKEVLGLDGFTRLYKRLTGWTDLKRIYEGRRTLQSLSSYYVKKDWVAAYQQLKPLVDAGGHSTGLMMEYARAGYFAGNKASSIEVMEQVSRLHPDDFLAQYNLAYLLMQDGQYDRASKVLEIIGQKNPSILESRFALAGAYAGAGELDRAWPILDSILEKDPELLSQLLEGEKEYLQAIRQDDRFEDFEKHLNSRLKN